MTKVWAKNGRENELSLCRKKGASAKWWENLSQSKTKILVAEEINWPRNELILGYPWNIFHFKFKEINLKKIFWFDRLL